MGERERGGGEPSKVAKATLLNNPPPSSASRKPPHPDTLPVHFSYPENTQKEKKNLSLTPLLCSSSSFFTFLLIEKG